MSHLLTSAIQNVFGFSVIITLSDRGICLLSIIVPNPTAQASSVSGTREIGGFSFPCKCSCFVQIPEMLGMEGVFQGDSQVTYRHMVTKLS